MSLSFKDSLTNNAKNSVAATNNVAETGDENLSVASVAAYSLGDVAVFSETSGDWVKATNVKYRYYNNEYSDDDYSTVDELKNINLDSKQFNITQEQNSQYIPFQMPRYYDGFDLAKTTLSIYYVNKNNDAHSDTPVDVYYNDEYIRFAWLVSEFATKVDGILQFEIQARGTNDKGENYIWKSKSIDKLNVLQSLEAITTGEIGVSEEELETWYNKIQFETQKANEYAIEAKTYADQAASLVEDLEGGITSEVNSVVENRVDSLVTEKMDAKLSNYYTKVETYNQDEVEAKLTAMNTELKTYTNNAVNKVDLTAVIDNYATKTELTTALANQNPQNFATQDEVTAAIAKADISDKLNDYYTKTETYSKTEVDTKVANVSVDLSDYYTKTAVDALISNVDLKDYYNKTEVDELLANQDISDKLNDYYTKSETYNKTEVDNLVANVTPNMDGYATETYVDTKANTLNAAIEANKSSIQANSESITNTGKLIGDLQTEVDAIDKSPRLQYEATYNAEGDATENLFTLYQIENKGTEDETKDAVSQFTITGGSGGGASTSSKLYINYDKDDNDKNITSYVFTVENRDDGETTIYYGFSGEDSTGDAIPYANATWKIRKGTSGAWTTIKTETVYPGTRNAFTVDSKYVSSIGSYSLRMEVSEDNGGFATKTWSVQIIDVRIESSFNDNTVYPLGKVTFNYTPYGSISKKVHFILDGNEIDTVTTTYSGVPMAYEIPSQKHGSHLLEVYMTAVVNDTTIESNHIVNDIIWYDPDSSVPIIGTTYQEFTARQYDSTNIEYTVYDPSTETPTVTIAVDGVVVSTPTLTDSTTAIYTYKTDVAGTHTITITCGKTVKTLKATIVELDIDVAPITAGLAFDFNPSGKSNNDTDRVWTDGTVSMSVSDNFDWVNGGYQYDENGDQYFCIKSGTSATIDYKLFGDDAKKNGKEFKLIFKTTNVAQPDATFLSCVDNTTGTDNIGIQMDVHETNIYGKVGTLTLPYSEDDIIEFEFNISKNTETIPMVMAYEDGVSTRPMVYGDSHDFTQNTPKIISLGSDYCDLHIYRFKVYNTSLADSSILNNFIADARNAEEMIDRYDRNQIYDENGQLDPETLAEKCPWLRVYKVSAPYFTNNKKDKVPNTTIQQIYGDGDATLDNWTCYNCQHSGQGTSSNNYGQAGRNLDFIMNKSGIDGVKPYFILGDGSKATTVTLTRTSVPVAYLNAKVNIASSNNMTNAMLTNRYNKYEPYKRQFIRTAKLTDTYSDEEIALMSEEEQASALATLQEKANEEISYIKDTMEFYNCVVFIQETNEDISTHREFADNDWHFYAIGNIGDSKKTDNTRLTDIDDKYECCIEVMDVGRALSAFPTDTMINAMSQDSETGEYIWAKNENLGILYEKVNDKYVLTSDTTVNYSKTYYVDILEHDDFSEDYTYGWRYISDEDDENVINYCHNAWKEFYRFITTSTEAEFKEKLGNYAIVDSILYYYLFTTRYTLVDNRAKNLFWHYGKTGETDSDGNPIRKWDLTWGYDFDTALGLNNYGVQVYRYGYEDSDVDEDGAEVFRQSDSLFFCRIRDLFASELKTLYGTLESNNAWHAESFINEADVWQDQFPEELWRLDIERKYIRTYTTSYINGSANADFLTKMSNGKMKYHRRQWERNQEKYMASKYQTTTALNESVVIRCGKPSTEEKENFVVPQSYTLTLTPYAYMYLNVSYGATNPTSVRAEPGKEYVIQSTVSEADIINIWSASNLQSVGDLSACYAATVDISQASKLKELKVGNNTEGYDNSYFTGLTVGSNYLLETINVENVSKLTEPITGLDLLSNLKELYAHGSNLSGVTFADGGKIETAELPAISSIIMKNLLYLNNLDISDLSKLTKITVENCNTIDLLNILNNAPNLNRARITNIDWTLSNGASGTDDEREVPLLNRLYNMRGSDKDDYLVDRAVLTGKVQVPTIRQQRLSEYQEAWSELEITASTIHEQFAVTFVNDDGTVLEVQYVDKGDNAVDPTTRADNPFTPTKESTPEYYYVFDGWDVSLNIILAPRTITATYTEHLRTYTVSYYNRGTLVYSGDGLVGENIDYEGDDPTYTAEESTYTFYLFNRWD